MIIPYAKENDIKYAYLNIYPDQFKSEKEKEDEGWVKQTMDYFANKAYADYRRHKETFCLNYDLIKGILRPEDFYQEPEIQSFVDQLRTTLKLPAHVKMYSILTPPVNTLLGELIKRPDIHRIKAFDDESKSEELKAKTSILNEYIVQNIRNQVYTQLAKQGLADDEAQIEEITWEQAKDQITNYTSAAEKWANHVLAACKVDFDMKEKSEDAFRDFLISGREFFHVYEDNSKLGFNVKVVNPKNVWALTTPDKKYISDVTDRGQGAYAAGTVEIMDISQIIEEFPDLSKEEIDHLRESLDDWGLINVRESNYGNPSAGTGEKTIKYDVYDKLILQERMMIEGEMREHYDELGDYISTANTISAWGYKYVVVRAYFLSKKKIGRVNFIDLSGNPQTMLVDENYKDGDIPDQIGKVEWGWINQWYQGTKIGPDVYHMKPFRLLPYCPIIGQVFETKNTECRSLVDMMKPFQVLYNICMNQLYQLLEKEIGNVGVVNLRRIPRVKDGDGQDDIDAWELEARQRGVMFDDDSPENTKGQVSNQSVARNVDLTRTNEIQSRYQLAVQLKNECWELVGLSRQRVGSVQATETATATQTALTQSYSQTEPIFAAHEYILNQLYQAVVDAAQYVESNKEQSTISYITGEGESAFIQVNGTELTLRDLKVFATSRPQDIQAFNELRQLAQPLLQNGGTFAEVIELYSTNSIRQMKEVFYKLKAKQEEFAANEQALQQQQMEQQGQQAQQQAELQYQIAQEQMVNDNYNKEMDRLNKKEVALINALGRNENATADVDNSGVADALEITRQDMDRKNADRDYNIALQEMQSKQLENASKMAIELEKLQVERENMANDLQIEKMRAKTKAAEAKKKAKANKTKK